MYDRVQSTRMLSARHIFLNTSICSKMCKFGLQCSRRLGGLDYKEIPRKLDLPTPAYRRARGDMIDLYKHFHVYDRATLPEGSSKLCKQFVQNMLDKTWTSNPIKYNHKIRERFEKALFACISELLLLL